MTRLPHTPNSRIRQALRILWLRSRERSQALKNTDYRCARCGVKQSSAKGREIRLDVHHLKRVTNWDRMFAVIREELLVSPEHLAPLCEQCHGKETT
jgi:5-methylcytosine-specific restriction endonuclease McrA